MAKIIFLLLMVAAIIVFLIYGEWDKATFFVALLILWVVLASSNDIEDIRNK